MYSPTESICKWAFFLRVFYPVFPALRVTRDCNVNSRFSKMSTKRRNKRAKNPFLLRKRVHFSPPDKRDANGCLSRVCDIATGSYFFISDARRCEDETNEGKKKTKGDLFRADKTTKINESGASD